MPTLGELRSRYSHPTKDTRMHSGEELLVADSRALMRPAQMVEEKLRTVMQANGAQSQSNASGRLPGRSA